MSRKSLLGLLCLSALVACSDNPNALKLFSGRTSAVVTPTTTLDQSIDQLISLFPKDLGARNEQRIQQGQNEDLNPRATWISIKKKYAAGASNPAQLTAAKKELFRLSDWVTKNALEMNTPPDGETKTAAAARLVLYMSMYVYGGPNTPPPSYTPGADATVGVVTPTAPATIVTPTLHAGVQLEAGSVAENTVIVVTQNPTPYPANCSGPLRTKFCQYPQFYTFEMFPHKKLLKAATFNVCHVNTGDNRYPLADHDRFTLAHAKPADPANYVPGGRVFSGNGESIEILPKVHQDFSSCIGNSYATSTVSGGPLGMLSRLARGLQKLVTPKTAYAIDLGLGGLSFDTSPFNVLDTLSSPDIAVQTVSATPASAHPGDHITLSYTVTNIGTATLDTAHAAIVLTPVSIAGDALPGQQLTSFEIYPMVPGSPHNATNLDVVIPGAVSAGSYQISLRVADDEFFPDANLANNSASATLSITPEFSIVDLGILAGDEYSQANAINGTGQVVGFSGKFGADRAFVWQNGAMTELGVTGGVESRATAINDNGEVVGLITLPSGGSHAFRWKDGVTTDLGTLPGTTSSGAYGINNTGQIVGWSYVQGTGRSHAWIWQSGTMTDLGVLPDQDTFASAINNAGQVVGFKVSGVESGWLWQGGSVTSLGGLGTGRTSAFGINGTGQVVGGSDVAPEQLHPFLWSDGVMTDLGTLGGTFGVANGIADDGRVVGSANLPSGVNHAFLWQNGHMTDLGTLGGARSNAQAIRSGKIVGNAVTPGGTLHASLWNVPMSP